MVTFLLVLIFLAGAAFSMINGMNDLSGLNATLVATRAMGLSKARFWTVTGVLLGGILGTDAVSQTVAEKIVFLNDGLSRSVALEVWLGSLVGGLCWVLLARKLGVPTSATHAFVGAMVGAAFTGTRRPELVNWGVEALFQQHQVAGVMKVFVGLIASPLMGGFLGYLLFKLLALLLKVATPAVNRKLRVGEALTVFVQAFCYGLNDAHGPMGILTGACLSAGLVSHEKGAFFVPMAVKLTIVVAIGIGGLQGSANILKMMGRGLIHVRPAEALSAQAASAGAVLLAAIIGAPVSSSQVTSSAIVGVGGAWRPRHVRWRKVRDILATWVITFPCAAVVGGLVTLVLSLLG